MTPDEILRKHEDANEMHFHEVDRKFIIEAMEEYAKEKSEKPIILSGKQTAVEWLVDKLMKGEYINSPNELIEQAKEMEREQCMADYKHGQNNGYMYSDGNGNIITAAEYYNQTYGK